MLREKRGLRLGILRGPSTVTDASVEEQFKWIRSFRSPLVQRVLALASPLKVVLSVKQLGFGETVPVTLEGRVTLRGVGVSSILLVFTVDSPYKLGQEIGVSRTDKEGKAQASTTLSPRTYSRQEEYLFKVSVRSPDSPAYDSVKIPVVEVRVRSNLFAVRFEADGKTFTTLEPPKPKSFFFPMYTKTYALYFEQNITRTEEPVGTYVLQDPGKIVVTGPADITVMYAPEAVAPVPAPTPVAPPTAAPVPAPVAPAPAGITGWVTSTSPTGERTPVSGARIQIDGAVWGFTDAQGQFNITGISPGTWSFTFWAQGYSAVTVTRTVGSGVNNLGEIILPPLVSCVNYIVDEATFRAYWGTRVEEPGFSLVVPGKEEPKPSWATYYGYYRNDGRPMNLVLSMEDDENWKLRAADAYLGIFKDYCGVVNEALARGYPMTVVK